MSPPVFYLAPPYPSAPACILPGIPISLSTGRVGLGYRGQDRSVAKRMRGLGQTVDVLSLPLRVRRSVCPFVRQGSGVSGAKAEVPPNPDVQALSLGKSCGLCGFPPVFLSGTSVSVTQAPPP